MRTDVYALAPRLTLAVTGAPAALRHFAREYGSSHNQDSAHAAPDVVVDVDFSRRMRKPAPAGRHKTVLWAVDVAPPNSSVVSASIVLGGRPRQFALSLVQGFVVEPLVSVAAALHANSVLLPAAALATSEGAVVLLGRSRSGKSSLIARAVSAGHDALGDDQVLLDRDGRLRRWPRRLRVYPDLRTTAPAAVAALPARRRAALAGLGLLAKASHGAVAPSLPLAWSDLGGSAVQGPLPIRRIIVLDRAVADPRGGFIATPLSVPTVIELAEQVLVEQRARMRSMLSVDWTSTLGAVESAEADTLRSALQGVPAERWTIPNAWSAPRAVRTLAVQLGLER